MLLGHMKTPCKPWVSFLHFVSVLCWKLAQWWIAAPLGMHAEGGWAVRLCNTTMWLTNSPTTCWWEPPSLPGVTGVEGQVEVRSDQVGSALWLVSYKAVVSHKACLPTAEHDAIQKASSAPGRKRGGAALGRGVSPWPNGRYGVAPHVLTWTLQRHRPHRAVSPVCLCWSPPENNKYVSINNFIMDLMRHNQENVHLQTYLIISCLCLTCTTIYKNYFSELNLFIKLPLI